MDQLPAELAQQFEAAPRLTRGQTGVLVRAVHRATRESGLLKVLHPEMVHAHKDRLEITAELDRQGSISSARLSVPSAWGEVGGTLWLFRPWVDGHSLERLAKSQGMPTATTSAAIMMKVAEGLEALHRAELLHRDLKPRHVICDSRGEAVIIDSGIAAPLVSKPSIRGTATYLAPEVVVGEPPSVRSDLYALGCVLFELLTGRPPFVAGDEAALLEAHVHQPIPPLPQGLDAQLRELLVRLLNKDPARRPVSVSEVLYALEPGSRGRRPRAGTAIGIGPAQAIQPTEPSPPADGFAAEATMQLDLADLMSSSDFDNLRPVGQAPAEPTLEPQQAMNPSTDDADDFEAMRTQAVSIADQTWDQAPTRVYDVDEHHDAEEQPSVQPAVMSTAPAPQMVDAPMPHVASEPSTWTSNAPAPGSEMSGIEGIPSEASMTLISPRTPERSLAGAAFLLLLLGGAAGAFHHWGFEYSSDDLLGYSTDDLLAWIPGRAAAPITVAPAAPPLPEPKPPSVPAEPPAAGAVAVPGTEPEPTATADSTDSAEGEVDDTTARVADRPRRAATKPRTAVKRIQPIPVVDSQDEFIAARAEARAAYGAGDWAAAERAYVRASELNPKNAGVLAGLGTSRLRQRDTQGAIAAFEGAVTLEPKSANFWAALARAYRIDGQRASSESAYQRALELDPDNLYALEALGVKPIE